MLHYIVIISRPSLLQHVSDILSACLHPSLSSTTHLSTLCCVVTISTSVNISFIWRCSVVRMAKDLRQRIIDTVQSGLNSTVYSLQAAVQTQPQGSAFYPTTLDQMASPIDVHLLPYIFIVLWHCWFGSKKGIGPVEELCVVMYWS